MSCHGYMQAHVYDLPQISKNTHSKENSPICDVTSLQTDLDNIIVRIEWVSEWVSEWCLTSTQQFGASWV